MRSTVDRKDSASQSLDILWYCILGVSPRWGGGPDSKDLEHHSQVGSAPRTSVAVRDAGVLTSIFGFCKSKGRTLLKSCGFCVVMYVWCQAECWHSVGSWYTALPSAWCGIAGVEWLVPLRGLHAHPHSV